MMTLDEAIKHCEEVAEEQDKLCKRYDDASGYSRSHNESIRVADAKWCERCAKEHRQLAEWLKDYKRLKEQEPFKNAYIQVVKERDIAIGQLNELGYSLGKRLSLARKSKKLLLTKQ
jgi:thiol-disulfide isomerase/thioredoxin